MALKILHTSDWHIGQRLYTKTREAEHQHFFDFLIDTIHRQQIDLLLVAGDIFDTGHPSNSSLQMYYNTLMRLQQSPCRHVVITGGNHDSESLLNAPREVLKYLNVHVFGGASSDIRDELLTISVEGEQCIVAAVPFLRDRDVRQAISGENYQERHQAIREGIMVHYQELAELVEQKKSANNQSALAIAMGHFFATGSKNTPESEREIHVGNLGEVNISKLPEVFDYVALGHIHRPQLIGGKTNVRYSGAPIPLSFSERDDLKQLIILQAEKGKLVNIESVEVPVYRRLIALSGNWQHVKGRLIELETQLADNDNKPKPYIELKIEEEQHDPHLLTDVEHFIDNLKRTEILKYAIRYIDNAVDEADQLFDQQELDELSEKDVFLQLLRERNVRQDMQDDLIADFQELLEHVQQSDERDS